MDAATRELVRHRAGNRCEYCRLPQHAVDATFHIEHVVAIQHALDDTDDPANLALACNRCNLCKGTNLASVDPLTNQVAPIFHPRRESWDDHFSWSEATIVGRTPTGRATARLLQMNARHRLELRATLIANGEFP
jgi:5-methylcytosine-specific restriction endonuclease McrA